MSQHAQSMLYYPGKSQISVHDTSRLRLTASQAAGRAIPFPLETPRKPGVASKSTHSCVYPSFAYLVNTDHMSLALGTSVNEAGVISASCSLLCIWQQLDHTVDLGTMGVPLHPAFVFITLGLTLISNPGPSSKLYGGCLSLAGVDEDRRLTALNFFLKALQPSSHRSWILGILGVLQG